MTIYKFEPIEDISCYELALVIKAFLLAMHHEAPNKNLEVLDNVVNYLVNKDSNLSRHFVQVDKFD